MSMYAISICNFSDGMVVQRLARQCSFYAHGKPTTTTRTFILNILISLGFQRCPNIQYMNIYTILHYINHLRYFCKLLMTPRTPREQTISNAQFTFNLHGIHIGDQGAWSSLVLGDHLCFGLIQLFLVIR